MSSSQSLKTSCLWSSFSRRNRSRARGRRRSGGMQSRRSSSRHRGRHTRRPGCRYPAQDAGAGHQKVRFYSSMKLIAALLLRRAYPDMLEVGRMEVAGETDLAESAHESASHFAAWTMVSAPLVLGFDLTDTTRLGLAWPTISNKLAMSVSQSWESDRADPSGSLIRSWQSLTKTSIVVGCGAGCNCADNPRAQPNCERWAKAGQCTANPGYMHAECAAACPSSLNASGWKLNGQSMVAPNGECVDVAGQLTPAPGSGLNWLRVRHG